MSLLDGLFNRGFNSARCKTLLNLTLPRMKLLRYRREIKLQQMRRDIAKLLETGQEATARIRVEHIIREENMMAAQDIIALFCELIVARLPIIQSQKECPLDLKEAISSICFAAPRCAELPELQQVGAMFAIKYGKEFVAAATELVPNCGVNRQVIELLSVRPPSAEVKLKLLKEIAEEYEFDWDPTASEVDFSKHHEDLLDGPTQFIGGTTQPLPEGKVHMALVLNDDSHDLCEAGTTFGSLDLPEVPKVAPKQSNSSEPTLKMEPEDSESVQDIQKKPASSEDLHMHSLHGSAEPFPRSTMMAKALENTQYVSFMELPRTSVNAEEGILSAGCHPSISSDVDISSAISTHPNSESKAHIDLQDVVAAAHNAAETAEKAALSARSAASLAQIIISELAQEKGEQGSPANGSYCQVNSFHFSERPTRSNSFRADDIDGISALNTGQMRMKSPSPERDNGGPDSEFPESWRMLSPEDSYFPYPDLFMSHDVKE